MRLHDDQAQQTAFEAWNDALLYQVDHRASCSAGCSMRADVCDIGLGYAAAEQQRWQDYHDARTVEVTA